MKHKLNHLTTASSKFLLLFFFCVSIIFGVCQFSKVNFSSALFITIGLSVWLLLLYVNFNEYITEFDEQHLYYYRRFNKNCMVIPFENLIRLEQANRLPSIFRRDSGFTLSSYKIYFRNKDKQEECIQFDYPMPLLFLEEQKSTLNLFVEYVQKINPSFIY